MSYLTFHRHSFYFQIRVPTALVARYGPVVRLNLPTTVRGIARPIALRLASDWLARFAGARDDGFVVDVSVHDGPEVLAPEPFVPLAAPAAIALPSPAPKLPITAETRVHGLNALTDASLFDTWNGLDRDREPSPVREMRAALRDYRRTCKVAWFDLTRHDVAAYRDHLLAKRVARAT